MKSFYGLLCLLLCSFFADAQTIREKLGKAAALLQLDPQMKHALLGLCVIKTTTEEKIFELNAQTGLAPASCQKIITSASALEMLGPDYRYTTVLGYDGKIDNGILKGNLIVSGSGDPTLGSWRYDSTKDNQQMKRWVDAIQQNGIHSIEGTLIGYAGKWDNKTIPGGWIWDDMGNYYGAGVSALNWHENQYDLVLRSTGVVGSKAMIVETRPRLYNINLQSELTAGEKGSGDNAYIYMAPNAQNGIVRGTIPVDEKSFVISGSFPDPALQMIAGFAARLDSARMKPTDFSVSDNLAAPVFKTISVTRSPALDSINYWFMKKSINLYGEALLKTMAYEKTGLGSTEKGLELVKKFWKEKLGDASGLHMVDGSGLSPQNRVTADVLVQVLQYAKDKPWFKYYYDALPVYNQMKLKSGTIGGCKSFAGYHTAKDGTQYTVAIIANNFEGSAGEIVKKMYVLLDELK